ncbi:MAG: LD-carboxypeptidase, partial [Chloroflexi bacterium]
IGRFQKKSEMTREMLVEIVRSKPELMKVPVVANADFGHTTPQFTFPVGGRGRLDAVGWKVRIEVVEH